jgi:uncharacterized protein involved in type VI secretion and phage assembly
MKDDNEIERCYGKYRATVIDNADPAQRGRLRLKIPDVLGEADSTWAEACVPLAGPTGAAMGVYLVPPVNTGVWVEFERGDADYPIWVGCIWGGSDSSSLPAQANAGVAASPNIVMQTLSQNSLVIFGGPGDGITLKATSGASISITELGITIDNAQGAKIELSGGKVSINGNALEVD